MSKLSLAKKLGIDLFYYFFKGARLDGALQWAGRSRRPLHEFPRPNATPVESTPSNVVYDYRDILRQWEIKVNGILTLKNNSKNFAYNVILMNAKELFATCENISKLTSIAPNDKLELKVSFVQYMVAHGGNETEVLPDIPPEKENKYLLIQYENERGTHFLTKFALSFTEIRNEYTYK